MTLRNFVIGVVALLCVGAALIAIKDPAIVGMAVLLGLLLIGLLIERQRYAVAQKSGGSWHRTGETFFDDESGEQLDVWYNPETGQRDYRGVT